MGFFEPHIKQYDRLVALAQTAASGAPVARQIDSPTWETEVLETLQPGASGMPTEVLALDARKWSQNLSPQQQKLRELRQQLNDITDEIKKLSDRPLERETKRFEMARVRRQASATALQLITALEARFAADEAKRGELLELKGECLQEEGAAFAAGVVFGTVMHSRYRVDQPTSEASQDPLWLNAETKSLKHLITHETLRQGLQFTEEEAETLASQLSDLEKQKANNPMDTLDQELGSLAFRKKLHDIELEELTGEVLGFISRQKRSIAGKILDFVWDVAAEITPSDQIKYISIEIQKLDREVMTGWGKTLIMAPTQADMLQRSQRLLEVTRLVEQHKAKLLQTLSEALSMPQNEAQKLTWTDLVDRISRLKQDYKEADTEFAVKQMAYRILAEEPSLAPDERNAIVTDPRSGFHFLEAFQGLLLAGRLTTGRFTLAQSAALRKELQKLTVDCLAQTKKVIDELEQLKQDTLDEKNYLTSWLENRDKEGRVSAETEPKTNRLREVKIELKDISATLKEFYDFVEQYEIESILNQAEGLFDEEMSKAEKLIQDVKQDGEAAINVAVQLGFDLDAIIPKLSQAASSHFFTSSHRQRLDQLNSRRSDLESQISSWRQEYQERLPRLFRQDLSDQLKNKKLRDPNPNPSPNPSPNQKYRDPNLQKITYVEPWSTSPLWKEGREKDLSQATIVAHGVQRAKIALDFTEEARISFQQALGGDPPISNGDLKSQLKNRVDLYLIDIMRINYLELFVKLSVEKSKLLKGILPDTEMETDYLDLYRQELAQLTAQYGSAEKSSLKQKTTDLSALERLVEKIQSAPQRLKELAEGCALVEDEVNSSVDEDKKMSYLEKLYQINLEREKAIQEVIDAQNSLQHLFTTEELDNGEITWLKQDLVERKKILQEQKAILTEWNLGKPLRTLDLQIDQLPDGLEKDRLEVQRGQELDRLLRTNGEAAINVAVQLRIDLDVMISKLSQADSSQLSTLSHRQRLDQLNSRRSELESQISSLRQEYQERLTRLFRQDLIHQLKNKKLRDPNPSPNQKLRDPSLEKVTYIEPWSTSPLWQGGREKNLTQATIVARGIRRASIALDFTEEARISLQQAMGGDPPISNGDLKPQLKNRVDLYLIDIMRINYLELFINRSVEKSKLLKGILPDTEIETGYLDPYRQELAQLTARYGRIEKWFLKPGTIDLPALERLVEKIQSAPQRLKELAERYAPVEEEVNSSIDEEKKMSHLGKLYQINLEREKALQEVIDAQNGLLHLFTTEELDNREIPRLKQDLIERKKVLQEQKTILTDWNLGKPLRTLDLQIDQLPDGLEKDRLEVQRGQELDRLLRTSRNSPRQQDPYPLLYYGRLAHDPQRRFSVAMARLRVLEDRLEQQLATPLELGQDLEGLRDAVNKNGQLLEEMRLELVKAQWAASSASEHLPKPDDNNAQELVNYCKSLLRQCQQQQKLLYHHYNEASQQLLPEEETTNIWHYLHELEPAIGKSERKFVAWTEEEWGPILFRDDPSFLPALKLAEEKIVEARTQRNEIVKELLSLQTKLKDEKGSSDRLKLEALQKETIGTYRKTLQYERDLQVQKHGMILNRILKVTTQISQQRIEILGKKPNAEAPAKVENEIITNLLKLEQQETVAELDASMEILQRAFDEEIRAYSSYPDPQLTLQELLTKELKGAAEELISLVSLKQTIHKPEEFRMRWEAAQLGYEWKSAAKEFLQKEGESIPKLLSTLVNEFLGFAEQHPGLAEALVTDIAITIDLLGDQTALTTLINGMHSRLLARGIIRGMGWGDEAEPPLEPKDLKWLALVDAGRYFPLAATGVQTAQAAVAGVKRAGLTGGFISALKSAVFNIPKNQLIQRIAKQTAPEHLDAVETTLRTLRGDSLGTLLASRQRVVAAQLAGELATAYFRPVAFLKGLANAIKGLTAEYHSSEPLEKQLRIGAVVGIPLAGLALLPALVWSVGLLLAGLIAIGAVTTGPIYAWRWINRAYPDTRKRVEVEERHAWVEKHPEFFQRLYQQQDAILASLQQTGAVPTSLTEDPALALVVGPADLDRMKNEAVETCRKEIEELYQVQKRVGGELQSQEVISLYLTHSYAQVDAMVGSQFPAVKDSLRQYLKDRVRLELYESWLKPKVHEACAYEFTVMVARYGSPKTFAQVMGRPRPGTQPIPLTVEEANLQKQAAFQAAAEEVKAALAKGKSVEVS